jgi:IS5 family transposase
MKQQALSMTGYFDKGKRTRREKFLAEMEGAVPWARLCALIEPRYPKGSPAGGRPPLPLERMFRVYCLQQWYFSMKVHTGMDADSGLVHTVSQRTWPT